MSDSENKNPEDGVNINLGDSHEAHMNDPLSTDAPEAPIPADLEASEAQYTANAEDIAPIATDEMDDMSVESNLDAPFDDGLDPIDVPLNDPADMLLDEEEFSEDAFYDEDMEDIDAFSSEWDESDDNDDSQADVFSTTGGKESVVHKLANNKAIKFGAIGIGGLAAVTAIYIFVLGGTTPAPTQQGSPITAQSNNSQAVKAALNSNSQPSAEPVSLFDSLENLPSPDPVPGKVEQTIDGQDLGDVFSILENSAPTPPAATSDFGAFANNSDTQTDDGVLNDFALPMPSPISANMPKATQQQDLSLDLPNPASAASTKDLMTSAAAESLNERPSEDFNVFEMDTPTLGVNTVDPLTVGAAPNIALPELNADLGNIATNKAPTLNANLPNADLSGIQDQLAKLNNRMDDMGDRIKDLEKNKTSSTSTSSSDLSRIESAIKRLERRIEDLGKNNNVLASAPAPKKTSSSTSNNVKKASTPRASSAPKKATTPKQSNARSWTLRGASPDQAFIAKKSGGNVQTVRVGDRVAGLGTIRFIGLEKGSWVVKTSGGTIKQ